MKVAVFVERGMWLVKSAGVNFQARYKRDDSLEDKNLFVRSVALGGDFMKGNKLILSPLDDAVTYNGKEILQTEESVADGCGWYLVDKFRVLKYVGEQVAMFCLLHNC